MYRCCLQVILFSPFVEMLKKNKLGLRICTLYVEKKIFYSLVFSTKTTVWRFHWVSRLQKKNTSPETVLSTFSLSAIYR